MNNKKVLKLIKNVFIVGVVVLFFLYIIFVSYLNDIGLYACFISAVIMITIIVYFNDRILKLEYLDKVELEKNMEEDASKIKCSKCGRKLTCNDIVCPGCGSNNIYYDKAIVESIDF